AEATLMGRLVVGADGRNSTVAKLVGSRKYNLTPNERFVYWSFFENAAPGPEPAIIFHRWAGRLVVACPADSGLFQALVIPERRELTRFRQDLEGSYLEYVSRCAPAAEALSGARRVGRIYGMLRWEGFFREASGPGWVLVGDAGHFKDPAPGQGIQDAFRQVDALAPVIVRGLHAADHDLDQQLRNWARWRDRDAAEHYWLATDLGKAGPAPAVVPEIARQLLAHHKLDSFLDLFNHRSLPSEVITPPRLLGATARLLTRPGCNRRALLREVTGLIAEDTRRRRLNRRPMYVTPGASADAGETEVEQSVAVT
ncbi:MAG TPA: hypothetical protein VE127_06330, partial [Solirubrobacteraceae bacterium]|nr:hypothetical protein [Solirubrobacteraceae bacterium]